MEIDHKLSKLFDVDNILWVITLWIDDLGTASHLGPAMIIYSISVRYNTVPHNKTTTSTSRRHNNVTSCLCCYKVGPTVGS